MVPRNQLRVEAAILSTARINKKGAFFISKQKQRQYCLRIVLKSCLGKPPNTYLGCPEVFLCRCSWAHFFQGEGLCKEGPIGAFFGLLCKMQHGGILC